MKCHLKGQFREE